MLVIILIVILFAALVILHEWGHFMAARRGGVGVEEFGIGFPPKIWGWKRRGTLYSINLLPLGGFVRLKGEDSADTGPHTFGGASFGVKTKVLLAGVGMNLVTAFVLLYALCIAGIPGLGGSFEPTFLHSTYAQPKQLLVADVGTGSPAAAAGLKRDDYLLSVDGVKMTDEDQLAAYTKSHAGKEVVLHVSSGGDERNVKVKLRDPGSTEGFLGVAGQQVYKLRYDPLSALVAAAYITGTLFVATIVGVVQLLLHLPVLVMGLFSKSVPQAAEAVSGPVGIVFILKSISSLGLSYVFLVAANIAVALAALNVLPIPALDGGRLAIIALQQVTKRRLSAETEARIHAVGFVALIGLMLLITLYDFRKYF